MKFSDKQYKYWIWFSRIEKLSSRKKEMLLIQYNLPEKIYNLDKFELTHIEFLNYEEVEDVLNNKYRENLEEYSKYMKKNNIQLITMFENEYPERLKNIYDKPVLLYVVGNTELLKRNSVAIVGSRNCSEYGKSISRKIAYDLAKQNICVISGLAKGIDKYSHIGALDATGKTIAVIGSGLDNIYPYENKNLYERIIKNDGLIVTEYVIGTKPCKINFPARNRIISGLSDAIVVVEAGLRSGALITADFGLEQGKEIFAIPGNINSLNSQGTNELIKQGAVLVTKSEDITDVLRI
ncbi:MAG: DNA-processing protein DprA [Clostridia bacterium]|nr:DNA-processing protein DprA [Clostridia bacterium]